MSERLERLHPETLNPTQQILYEDMTNFINIHLNNFQTIDDEGRFIGIWNALLHYPKIGAKILDLLKAITNNEKLNPKIKEICILTISEKYNSEYALYAHAEMAKSKHVKISIINKIINGDNLNKELHRDEFIAREITLELLDQKILPTSLYNLGLESLGEESLAELIFLIGFYSMICTTLNGFHLN